MPWSQSNSGCYWSSVRACFMAKPFFLGRAALDPNRFDVGSLLKNGYEWRLTNESGVDMAFFLTSPFGSVAVTWCSRILYLLPIHAVSNVPTTIIHQKLKWKDFSMTVIMRFTIEAFWNSAWKPQDSWMSASKHFIENDFFLVKSTKNVENY